MDRLVQGSINTKIFRKLPGAGTVLGLVDTETMDKIRITAVVWRFFDGRMVRRSMFDINTGEYVGEY